MKRTALLVAGCSLALGSAVFAPSSAGEPAWTPPVTVGSAGAYGGGADVAVAPDGRAVAVWTKSARARSRDTLMAATRPAGGGWGTPVVLAAQAPAHQFAEVEMAANGAATVVWQEIDAKHRVSVRARRITPDGAVTRTVRLGRADGGGGLPSLAVDPAGNATVAWFKQDRTRSWIEVVRRPKGGSWTDPERLSPRTGDAGLPIVAASTGGTVVVWPGASTQSGATRVWAARRVGDRWLPAERISARGSIFGADAVVTPTGDVTATWSRYPVSGPPRVEVAERPSGGAWQQPALLPGGQDGLDPAIATGGDGDTVVAWRSFTASHHSRTAASIRPVGRAWAPATFLSAAGTDVWLPRVVVDATGAATVAWEQRSGGRHVVAARHDPVAGWLPAQTLSAAGERAAAPSLDVAEDGAVTAVWTRLDGTNRVRGSRLG